MGMSFLKNFRNIDESSIEELIDKKIAIEKFQTIVYRIILFQFVLFIGFIAIGLTLDHYNNFKYYCEELLKKHSFLDWLLWLLLFFSLAFIPLLFFNHAIIHDFFILPIDRNIEEKKYLKDMDELDRLRKEDKLRREKEDEKNKKKKYKLRQFAV